MATCDVYYHGRIIGSGSIASGATQITSWNDYNAGAGSDKDHRGFGRSATADERRWESTGLGKNVQVVMTSGTGLGLFFKARTIDETGSTLDLSVASPYAT